MVLELVTGHNNRLCCTITENRNLCCVIVCVNAVVRVAWCVVINRSYFVVEGDQTDFLLGELFLQQVELAVHSGYTHNNQCVLLPARHTGI